MNAHLDISDRKKKSVAIFNIEEFYSKNYSYLLTFYSLSFFWCIFFAGCGGAVMLMTSERHTNLENRLLV